MPDCFSGAEPLGESEVDVPEAGLPDHHAREPCRSEARVTTWKASTLKNCVLGSVAAREVGIGHQVGAIEARPGIGAAGGVGDLGGVAGLGGEDQSSSASR